ncbi:MAG: BrnT family toxin [Thiobacillus sp.]
MGVLELDIAWDAAKAQSNLAKHGVSFTQAATVLADPLALTVFDEAHSETEERWFTLGMSSDGKLLAVAHTYRHTEPAHVQVRMISAREATRRECEQYANEP